MAELHEVLTNVEYVFFGATVADEIGANKSVVIRTNSMRHLDSMIRVWVMGRNQEIAQQFIDNFYFIL